MHNTLLAERLTHTKYVNLKNQITTVMQQPKMENKKRITLKKPIAATKVTIMRRSKSQETTSHWLFRIDLYPPHVEVHIMMSTPKCNGSYLAKQ